jgi:hypothetical protein
MLVDNDPQSPKDSAPPKLTMAPEVPPCVVLAVTVMLLGQSSVQLAPSLPETTLPASSKVLSPGWLSSVVLAISAVLVISVPSAVFELI